METKDYTISSQMVEYLCNFAKTGNPNSDKLPKWDSAKEKPNMAMNFGERPTGMRKPSGLKLLITMLTNKAVGE